MSETNHPSSRRELRRSGPRLTGPERLSLIAKRSGRTVDDVTELWHERAAIREYDAGKRRRDAEQLALDDVANEVLREVSAPRGRRVG